MSALDSVVNPIGALVRQAVGDMTRGEIALTAEQAAATVRGGKRWLPIIALGGALLLVEEAVVKKRRLR